jgi:hypothetical protein
LAIAGALKVFCRAARAALTQPIADRLILVIYDQAIETCGKQRLLPFRRCSLRLPARSPTRVGDAPLRRKNIWVAPVRRQIDTPSIDVCETLRRSRGCARRCAVSLSSSIDLAKRGAQEGSAGPVAGDVSCFQVDSSCR